MNMQRMTVPFCEIKLADSKGGVMSFSGYGAAFNNVDSYGDVIAPGAFAKFLSDIQENREPWPAMLSQHGAMGLTSEDLTPIGAWSSLSEDGKGLSTAGDLAKTQRGIEMHTLLSMKPRAAIDGLSIGYIAKKWDPRTKPEDPRRTLREIVLVEISPVTFPANRNARVSSVKSIEDMTGLSEIETYLREAGGFSRAEAKTLVARIKAAGRDDAISDLDQLTAALRGTLATIQGT
jgi:HK97 family phage prohead protease